MRSAALADKIVSFAEDSTRSIDRAIAAWPAEFKAIIWDAVAEIAVQRAKAARDDHGGGETARAIMSNIELTALPCPFCGGKDVSFDCNAYDTWWIMCECGVEINDCSSPKHAFERWNTRAPNPSGDRKAENG
jgi:hypothetical protein